MRDGLVITGGGVTAGIDFALTVLAEIAGPQAAQATQLGLEYAPEPPFAAGRPNTAPAAVLAACQARFGSMMARREAEARQAAGRLGLDRKYDDEPTTTAVVRHGRRHRQGSPRGKTPRTAAIRRRSLLPTRRTANGGTARCSWPGGRRSWTSSSVNGRGN